MGMETAGAPKKARSSTHVSSEQGEPMMFPEADTPLAKACDALVDAKGSREKAKEAYAEAVSKVYDLMLAQRKKTVKHGGKLFSIRASDPKVSVTIKEG